MNILGQNATRSVLSVGFALLFAIIPISLPAQTGRAGAVSERYGYALVKPLANDEEKAMLDKVEEIKKIPAQTFEARKFEASNRVTLGYRLLKPKNYEPGVKYPLVVVLHGSGAIGDDNVSQLGILAKSWAQPEYRRNYPCFVLAPQFPSRSVEYIKADEGGKTISKPLPPLYAAIELIEAFSKEYKVDQKRIYVMGFSMGGSSTMNALFLRPEMFAAAISIAGVPNHEMAGQITRVPLWIMHGNRDMENEFGPDKLMYEMLLKAGGRRVRFWEFDGVAHEVPARVFGTRELPDWLFNQHR